MEKEKEKEIEILKKVASVFDGSQVYACVAQDIIIVDGWITYEHLLKIQTIMDEEAHGC